MAVEFVNNNQGLCIYQLQSRLVKDPKDTLFRTIEQIADQPYIKYSDILSYDTIFHIIKLKYPVSELKQKINEENLRFAVTLDGEILYRGNFVYKAPNLASNEPIILLDDKSDTLANDEIRIYSKFPIASYDFYNDLRYKQALNKRLKADNKACGKLFETSYDSPKIGTGIEFYFIEAIDSTETFNRNTIIDQPDLSKLILAKTPFISYNHIAFYDSAQYIFFLTEPVNFSNYTNQQLMEKFYAITINGKPVLLGGFYLSLFSSVCSYIHVFPDQVYQNPINEYLLRLYPGYNKQIPSSFINIPSIIETLKHDGKITSNFII